MVFPAILIHGKKLSLQISSGSKGTSTETYSTNLDLQVLLKHLHQDIPPKKHNDAGRLMKNKRLTKLYVTLLVLLWDLTFAESSKDNTVMASPHSSINCMRSAWCTHTYKYRSKHQMRCCQSCMASSYLFLLFRVWINFLKNKVLNLMEMHVSWAVAVAVC